MFIYRIIVSKLQSKRASSYQKEERGDLRGDKAAKRKTIVGIKMEADHVVILSGLQLLLMFFLL